MSEANQFEIGGHPLRCAHCGHDTFYTRSSLLNTRGLTLLKLDYLDEAAQNYICARCGYIMWFYDLQASGQASPTEPIDCLVCHTLIPASASTCPACGWSYKPMGEPSQADELGSAPSEAGTE
jgi:hypothetical protein